MKPQKELSTNVVINGKKYLVMTEDHGVEKHCIVTQIYLGGKILSTKKSDYKYILNKPDTEKKLNEIMNRIHEQTLTLLKAEKTGEKMTLTDYLDEIKILLHKRNHKSALQMLTGALVEYPNDPFLLSYHGCLEAILNKNYKQGIDTCLKAVYIGKKNIPFGQEFFYPVLYLNLGRAYLASGNKKDAIESFYKGLAFDHENKDLLREIKKLGLRKTPVVSFLPRSHPINRYIGLLLHKLKGT